MNLKKKVDIIVDMDVTSPLRLIEDIHSVIKLLNEKKVSNIITGSPARRSPYFNLVEEDENGVIRLSKKLVNPIFRRQDSPKCYDMNASIYAWKRNSLFKTENVFNDDTLIYIMPEERSVDIDNELDFKIVEMLIKKSDEI